MTALPIPFWPAMMRRPLAARYCDLSVAEFEREISAGRLPSPIMLGNSEHWSRTGLDAALAALHHGAGDYFNGSPLYGTGS